MDKNLKAPEGELNEKDLETAGVADAKLNEVSGGADENGVFFNPKSPDGTFFNPESPDGVFMNPKPEEGAMFNPESQDGTMLNPESPEGSFFQSK